MVVMVAVVAAVAVGMEYEWFLAPVSCQSGVMQTHTQTHPEIAASPR